ncbi:MAG: transglutaminase-like domain-containing protein [Desulfurococcales archaeon]|nr:transglutaminase-like domain-containing protein [Desulfurococcales archaeon]
MKRIAITVMILAVMMVIPLTFPAYSGNQTAYTILFAFIPEKPSSTGFTMGAPRWIPGNGQEAEVMHELDTPYYSCEMVKWSIKNTIERYKEAPLSTESTSLFNYTNPIVVGFIRNNITKLGLNGLSNKDKISKIADYVYKHFKYQVGQYPHYPWETIELRHGDCDDLAILVVTIARAYRVPSAVATGLLIIPGLESSIKAGGINYTIRGVAGHAWIIYENDKGEPVVMDRLVPLNAVPDERRIVLDYPVNGYRYVNQTRSEVMQQEGKAYIMLYNGNTCPSPQELENPTQTTSESAPQISISDRQAVIALGLLGWILVTLAYYIYSSVTKPYWSRW